MRTPGPRAHTGAQVQPEVERELIVKCQAGQAQFYEPLVRAYEQPGLRLALGMMGNAEEVLDASRRSSEVSDSVQQDVGAISTEIDGMVREVENSSSISRSIDSIGRRLTDSVSTFHMEKKDSVQESA